MKPGIYTNSYSKDKKFTTLFSDGTGWNWSVFADGRAKQQNEEGLWVYSPYGSWVKTSKHEESMEKFISPFELVRW